jgi:hypothetical protein
MAMSTPSSTGQAAGVISLMSQCVEETMGVEQAIALSSDGIVMAVAPEIERDDADRLSALIIGMRALGDGASRMLDTGTLDRVLIETSGAYVLVATIPGGSALAVVANRSCDLGLLGYEVTLLTQRIASQLTPELISELKTSVAVS